MPDPCGPAPPDRRRRSQGAEAPYFHHVRLAGAERRLSAGADRPHLGGCYDSGDGGKCGLRLCPAVLLLVYLQLLLYASAEKTAVRPWRGQLLHTADGFLQLERPLLPGRSMDVRRGRISLRQYFLRPPVYLFYADPYRDPLRSLHTYPGAGGAPPLRPAGQPPVLDDSGHFLPARCGAYRLCVQAHRGVRFHSGDAGRRHVAGGDCGVEPAQL